MHRYKLIISCCIHGVSKVPITHHHHHLFHSSSTTDLMLKHINNFLSIRSPKTLQSLTKYHAYMITTGHHSTNIFISSKLISLYAYLRNPTSSKQVFDSFHGYKDVFLWNSIIKAYFSNGIYPQCLAFYDSMRVFANFLPNQFTIPMIVSACAELGDLIHGMIVHGSVFKVGIFEQSSAIGSSFVYMYSKCGYIQNARQVFDEMPLRDFVAWTALIIGHVQNGESEKGLKYVCEMYNTCGAHERPNYRTFEGGFQACGDLEAVNSGRCLHGASIKSGHECSTVQSSILSMYSKCGTPEEAYISFSEISVKDIRIWTSIITVYAKHGFIKQCFAKFMDMIVVIDPDPMVISCVISGLTNSTSISAGKTFHGFIVRRNYDGNQMVDNALVSMYCKFGIISYAENVFSRVCDKKVWNPVVHSYYKLGFRVKCVELFTKMLNLGIIPDCYSLSSVISSCSQMRKLRLGKSLHGYVVKNVMNENLSVSNSLMEMYFKNGELTIAKKLFCRIKNKDIITWNVMISGYMHCGDYPEAFLLFKNMILEGIEPSVTTLVIMVSVCAQMASFEKGEEVCKYIDEEMILTNLPLATALIDMYAKCGKLEKSEEIFNKLTTKDVISWNVMISGYAMHGNATSAIDIFRKMERSGVEPNELTFLAVLSACNHAGLVNEGKELFKKMGDYYGLKPAVKHYTCMVDLFGRSGYLVEAENLVLSMSGVIVPDGGLWGALLSACKTHNNPEIGIRVAKRAIECDPKNDGYYVLISNMYDSLGLWEEAEKMRRIMKERGLEKAVGWSAV